MNPRISIIAVIGKNRELGKDNKLLWHISEDLKRFKQLTMGHPVIMGHTTFRSIGRPLPGRTNIVVSRDPDLKIENCLIAHSIKKAIEEAKKLDNEKIFIIGGGKIYQQSIDLADRLYLTVVNASTDADTYFPVYSNFNKIISKKVGQSGILKYQYLTLKK